MAKRMLVDATHPEETRVVVVNGTKLEDFDFETSTKKQLKGNIYLAKVVRIEPSLQAAFVEYGGNRHGFLAFNEIHPDYYQIPVADRERLLAEQHRERMAHGDMDDEVSSTGSIVDKSDIVEAREEREALVSEHAMDDIVEDQAGAAPDHEPASQETLTGEAPDTATPPQDEAAAPPHDAGLPPPFEIATTPEPASTEAAAARHETGGPSDIVASSAEPERPFPAAAGPTGISEDEQAPPRQAAAIPSEVLQGPYGDVAMETGEGIEGAPADGTMVAAAEPLSVDPAEAPQPAVSVETLGGDADLVEVRRPRRQPPSRHYKIQEVIKRRQIMLVQVVKEERGNKGAALTTYLSLAGRYCVLMPNAGRGGGISRKITSATDRKRMKEMLSELEVPQGMGVILRTAGLERSKPDIRRDYEYLMRLWDGIREFTLRSTAPALIYEESDLIKRSIRDLYNSEIDEILVEGESGYQRAHDFMRQLVPQHTRKVQTYDDRIPLFHRYQIESQLDAMHSPVVQLRTGAYIVINPTEALVAIDVNSGRATKERNIEETALRTNLEAADEIARQVRLRDLSGLIVIDFIDMEDNRHQQQVERRLKEAMRSDRARIQIGRISPFGLLELSRQRLRPSLLENFTEVCHLCEGTGRVRSVESTSLHVLRAIEDEGIRQRAGEVAAAVPVAVALYILNHKRRALQEIEERYGFHVVVAGDDELIAPQYRIERTRARVAPLGGETGPQAPLTASAIYQEFEDEYEEEGEAPVSGAEGAEDAVANGDDAGGDDGGRRGGRRRRRRRRRREGGDEERVGSAADESNGEAGGEHEMDEPAETAAEGAIEPANDDAGASGEAASVDGAPGEDGDRRRRRRGRRGGRNRRHADNLAETGDWPRDVAAPSELPDEPIDPAGEDEEGAPVRPPVESPQVHAAETDADDSLAPASPEPAVVAAMEQSSNVTPIMDTPAGDLTPAREDAAPAPSPSSGSDVAAVEEKPAAPQIPVTLADTPPPAPRRGWWSKG